MTALTDALIEQLANAECPKVYGHEAKAMAQEILAYRNKAREAAKQAAAMHAATHQAAGGNSSVPWPYGGSFP